MNQPQSNSDYQPNYGPDYWGIDNDYGVLRDVLLGKPKYFKWVEAGPLIGRTLKNMHKTGIEFDFDLSQRQFDEMVKIYEDAGVTCHYLDSDPVLHRNFFARDSSAMTPWGALICHMQLKCRRADYVTTIKFYQDNHIPIWNYATAGHFEGGDFVILEPGNSPDRILWRTVRAGWFGTGGRVCPQRRLGRRSCADSCVIRAYGRVGGAAGP